MGHLARALNGAATIGEVDVQLRSIDEEVLQRLLLVAMEDADLGEVMPPVAGPAGWTPRRREAFRAFHRTRRDGLAGRQREATFAVVYGEQIVGSARLASRPAEHGVLETGIWLARGARGRGIGTALLGVLLEEAARAGASRVVAETTAANRAALGVLRRCGATLSSPNAQGSIRAELPLPARPAGRTL